MIEQVSEGTVTEADRARSPFYYLPFQVPEGASRIAVEYQYSGKANAWDPPGTGNVIDIGIFDPRAQQFPSRTGFRGWCGSIRPGFFLALDDATPGYLPGPLPAGQWQIILGLYRVMPQGSRYTVKVQIETGGFGAATLSPPVPYPTYQRGPSWLRGDLHCHTYHSDARGSPEELAEATRMQGLDFLAVTDHNTSSHHPHLHRLSSLDLLLIPGEEVTTYWGHANVWGIQDWVDFRLNGEKDLPLLIAEAHRQGALISINHPKNTGTDWEYSTTQGFDCFEVWQSPWPYRNWESLARWDKLLCAGQRITGVGGSDRHQPPFPQKEPRWLWVGSPTTWVYAQEQSIPAILDGLRSGQVCIAEGPSGPRLELTAHVNGKTLAMGQAERIRPGTAVQFQAKVLGGAGNVLQAISSGQVVHTQRVPGDDWTGEFTYAFHQDSYLRLELIVPSAEDQWLREALPQAKLPRGVTAEEILAHPRRRALSNPIYFEMK